MLPGDLFCLGSFPATVKTVSFLKLRAREQGKSSLNYFSEVFDVVGYPASTLGCIEWLRSGARAGQTKISQYPCFKLGSAGTRSKILVREKYPENMSSLL